MVPEIVDGLVTHTLKFTCFAFFVFVLLPWQPKNKTPETKTKKTYWSGTRRACFHCDDAFLIMSRKISHENVKHCVKDDALKHKIFLS